MQSESTGARSMSIASDYFLLGRVRLFEEIRSAINLRIDTPQTGLVARWSLDEGWGTAVHEVVSAMPSTPVPDSTVVQLIGAVGHGDPLVDGAELGRRLAQKLHASFRFLSAPLLVDDEAVAAALRRERTIEETLAMGKRADVALIGIGTPQPELSSLVRAGYLSRSEIESLMASGVVGDIVAHQFDENGNWLDIPA